MSFVPIHQPKSENDNKVKGICVIHFYKTDAIKMPTYGTNVPSEEHNSAF